MKTVHKCMNVQRINSGPPRYETGVPTTWPQHLSDEHLKLEDYIEMDLAETGWEYVK